MAQDIFSRNGFSLDRLVTLCAVVDAGSIAAAAANNVSRQSQFSRQIRELEAAMGGRLFRRVGKTLQPTSLGLQLARMSRVYLGGIQELVTAEASKPTLLNIGGGEGLLRWILVPALGSLHRFDPPVHLRIRSLRSADVVRELELGRIDLGLVRKTALGEHHQCEVIGTFDFILAIPRGLLRNRRVEEATNGRLIPYAELMGEGQLATAARDVARVAGIQLGRTIQAATLSLLLAMVERGEAAAFLPVIAAGRLPQDQVALLRVPEMAVLSRDIVLAWISEVASQNPALPGMVRALSTSLREVVADARRRVAETTTSLD
jgi:DNA-binding transcriptional LysR family regulator